MPLSQGHVQDISNLVHQRERYKWSVALSKGKYECTYLQYSSMLGVVLMSTQHCFQRFSISSCNGTELGEVQYTLEDLVEGLILADKCLEVDIKIVGQVWGHSYCQNYNQRWHQWSSIEISWQERVMAVLLVVMRESEWQDCESNVEIGIAKAIKGSRWGLR